MKQRVVNVALAAACAAMAVPTAAGAQGPPGGLPPQAQAEVTFPVHVDASNVPLRDMPDRSVEGRPRGGRDFEPGRPEPVGHINPPGDDPLASTGVGASSALTTPSAFTDGTPVDPQARVAPPDTTGDLGPNHYVQWVNLRYSIYTLARSGGTITGFTLVPGFPKNGNTVWSGFGGACETMNDGDPIVQYDQLADRWVLTQFAVSATPYTQCVAVSKTGDPTGEYYRYAYTYGTDFNDYPKMAVWPDGYYITYNMFRRGRTFSGTRVCAFERDRMLVGQTARQLCVNTTSGASLLPADLEGRERPPAGAPNHLLSITSSSLQFWTYKVTWAATATGTLTGPTTVAGAAAFSRACGGGRCIPQLGTSQQLDSLADRLMYRLSYRNFGTREALVVNHSVASGGVSGIRWYELAVTRTAQANSDSVSVRQQGTFQPTNDPVYRWMGTAAMDKTGGIAIGYNVSSTGIKPGIRYAIHAPADVAGTLGAETSLLVGPGAQTGNSLSRWGDYATMSVDPTDDCTMVFTTEYIPEDGSFNWKTAIHSFKLSTCP